MKLFLKTQAKTLLTTAHAEAKIVAEQELAKTPAQLHQEKIQHALAEVERAATARDHAAIALRNWRPQDGPRAPLIAAHAIAVGKCNLAMQYHCQLLNKKVS